MCVWYVLCLSDAIYASRYVCLMICVTLLGDGMAIWCTRHSFKLLFLSLILTEW